MPVFFLRHPVTKEQQLLLPLTFSSFKSATASSTAASAALPPPDLASSNILVVIVTSSSSSVDLVVISASFSTCCGLKTTLKLWPFPDFFFVVFSPSLSARAVKKFCREEPLQQTVSKVEVKNQQLRSQETRNTYYSQLVPRQHEPHYDHEQHQQQQK